MSDLLGDALRKAGVPVQPAPDGRHCGADVGCAWNPTCMAAGCIGRHDRADCWCASDPNPCKYHEGFQDGVGVGEHETERLDALTIRQHEEIHVLQELLRRWQNGMAPLGDQTIRTETQLALGAP